MKRLFSRNDCNGYTYMKQVLINLDLVHQDYLWLISDIEAFPNSNDLNKEIEKVDYLLLTTQEFVEILDEEDFQWIWAVFSAIPSKYTKEEILKYPFPIIESVAKDYNPFLDEPKIQHPLADFEICSCDASEMFIVSDDESLLSKFKASYPLSIDDTEHKVIFDDWRLREPNVFKKRKKEYFSIQSFMVVFLIAFFALSFIYYYFFIFTLILVFTCLSVYLE
ncbi:MAG: hypothetical protein K2J85_06710, partial [Anaeroplasmataceae bacterium]|nr:hypothetical protein [Anaeroplasmataceae bacterium]